MSGMRKIHRYLDFNVWMRNLPRGRCMTFHATWFLFEINTTARFPIHTIIYNLTIILVLEQL